MKNKTMKALAIILTMAVSSVMMTGVAAASAKKETVMPQKALKDGSYTVDVTLTGGSGKSTVESPAALTVREGKATATLVWTSPNYDYMIVDEEKYTMTNTEGNSTFEIPVEAFDCEIPVIANTVAMGEPHEIAYTLRFDSSSIEEDAKETVSIPGLTYESRMPLTYAEEFSVDYFEGGYALITIAEEGQILVVPEDGAVPKNLDKDIVVLKKPLDNIYLVATSAMDLFRAIDGMGAIRLSGTKEEGWYVPEAREAMAKGDILYAGKYNAPDYERILQEECSLAIESTMIHHNPEVKEKLEQFGIPVLVERSSYESHPLGRTEWMKLYGVLLDREEEAQEAFEAQADKLRPLSGQESSGKKVAFFYINSTGAVNVRKSNDYVSNMIELAGGVYVPETKEAQENALSTMNMQMEEFYAGARDADYIIYNSTIDGELTTIEELVDKSSLLADFKAVQEGNVWCVRKNLFQETTGLGTMIADIHTMLTEENPETKEFSYMYRLQ